MDREALLAKWSQKQHVLGGQGWLRVVDVMGDDGAIVEAARVATGKGRSEHKWVEAGIQIVCDVCNRAMPIDARDAAAVRAEVCTEGDRRLLDYMMAHRHTSPYEMCEVKLHVYDPMDVWRQWIRHRTASVQEYSTRYSPAIDEMLVTPPDAWRLQSKSNRQGSTGTVTEWPEGYGTDSNEHGTYMITPTAWGRHMSPDPAAVITPGSYLTARERDVQTLAREVYAERITFGVAYEQARKDLPLSNFTTAYWKIDLHNLFHFLSLRVDPHAQKEIREYADVIQSFVAEWCPLAFGAFVEHRRDAVTLSASQARALRKFLADAVLADGPSAVGSPVTADTLNPYAVAEGVTGRARADFLRKLGVS